MCIELTLFYISESSTLSSASTTSSSSSQTESVLSSSTTATLSSTSSSETVLPSPIPTNLNIQTLHVSSDGVIPTVEMCKNTDLVFSGAEGYITSPYYSSGSNYALNQECVLHIVNNQNKVSLTFI